jgi:cyclopropane-fatty-acyl-phospholipid synthase
VKRVKDEIQGLLAQAGIKINGPDPWDVQIHNTNFYQRFISKGSLGLGESYMDGWWDAEQLDQFFCRILNKNLDNQIKITFDRILMYSRSMIFNMQSRNRSKKVIREHYDLDNDLYMSFLDPYNQYTCGYFKDTESLNEAQENKLNLICKKLQIKPDDKVLDIGCGWGGFAKFAAERYGCQVTGITISDRQLEYAEEYCKGLPVQIVKKDYRDLNQAFDKILICGMIEHVGYKNYKAIMKVVQKCLSRSGLFLLHTIGRNTSTKSSDPWISKYIFPNSMLPSIKQISKAAEGHFMIEDLHNFGIYYVQTLQAWMENFDRNWDKIKSRYDERFYRMWKYYLLSCAGAFEARSIQLWQFVLSASGVEGGYQSVR